MADPLELLALDSHMAVAGCERLFVVATLQPPTAASIRRFERCLLQRRADLDQRLLAVVIPAAPRPALDPESREAMLRVWDDFMIHVQGCAIWIRRGSFVGALQRSLVTGILMARRIPIVADVTASAEGAVSVLARAEPSLDPNTRAVWRASLERFAAEHTSPS